MSYPDREYVLRRLRSGRTLIDDLAGYREDVVRRTLRARVKDLVSGSNPCPAIVVISRSPEATAVIVGPRLGRTTVVRSPDVENPVDVVSIAVEVIRPAVYLVVPRDGLAELASGEDHPMAVLHRWADEAHASRDEVNTDRRST